MPAVASLRLLLVAAALVACGLAGCAGDAGADVPADGDATSPDAEAAAGRSLLKPAWAVGDAWVYEFNGDSTTYVIASETETDWIMETDSPERSFADLREDISRLGPQRKSDLAGSQGEDRVEFFRWPLEAGKTWSTRWDQLDIDVRVVDLVEGVATLEATRADDGSLAYRYTFSAGERWFGDLRHFASDGAELVHLSLKEAVRSWTGTLARWTLEEVVADASGPTAQPPLVAGPFDVPAGTTDIWADYHFTCTGTGGFSVAIEPLNEGLPAQPGMQDSGPCTQVDWSGPTILAPHPGRWAFALSAGGETVAYAYTLLLRTRADVPFPA